MQDLCKRVLQTLDVGKVLLAVAGEFDAIVRVWSDAEGELGHAVDTPAL